MLNKHFFKKALILSAFLISSCQQTHIALADTCVSKPVSAAEKATVKWVYDGDTLLLTDKRKIRIIGIDTPETKHHKQKAQAYGAKAREALREKLKSFNYQVSLRYGKEKRDKYSRILAHVYLPDGTNISSWMLKSGFARTLPIPPNIKLADCYKQAEESAQLQSLKIWRLKKHQLQDATTLPQRVKGYVRLKGKITNIKHYKKHLFMELESNSRRHIQLKVKKKNLRYFNKPDPDNLLGKTIVVSGILKNKYGKHLIYLNHASQLKVQDKRERVAPTIKWSSP